MNNYEGVVIARAALEKEAQEKLVEEIKEVITKSKGEIAQVQNWGKKRLAYPIEKQNEGMYYFLEFQLDPLVVKKIENAYKLNDGILRVLIVRKTS